MSLSQEQPASKQDFRLVLVLQKSVGELLGGDELGISKQIFVALSQEQPASKQDFRLVLVLQKSVRDLLGDELGIIESPGTAVGLVEGSSLFSEQICVTLSQEQPASKQTFLFSKVKQ